MYPLANLATLKYEEPDEYNIGGRPAGVWSGLVLSADFVIIVVKLFKSHWYKSILIVYTMMMCTHMYMYINVHTCCPYSVMSE